MVHSTYKTSIFQQMHLREANNGFLSIKASWCSVTKANSIMRVQLWTTQVLWYSMMTSRRWANFLFNRMKHRPTTNNLHINNQNENRKLNKESQRREHRSAPDNANAAMRAIVYQRQRLMKAKEVVYRHKKTKYWPKLLWVQFNQTIWSFQSQLQRTSLLQ